ncbi:C1 family peptidase [Chloroflexota bacterium]
MNEEKERIGVELGMGWLPDYPDFRDYTFEKEDVPPRLQKLGKEDSLKGMLTKIGVAEPARVSIPTSMDLRGWCPPIENQGNIGSCTANAGVGMVEYYERRAFGKHIDASRLFLYKATRNLLHWTGDTGAFLRTTMAALVLFGVPPEEYWRYVTANFDKEPSAFCYAFGQSYQAIQYYRLDPPATPRDLLLKRIKAFLAAGLPSMFGFTVFNSINQAGDDGKIPYPCSDDRILGGHAVVAVGFNDEIKIQNANCGSETTGALLIRNSWGTGWGDRGYGWLPYNYVLEELAIDWWSLLKKEWVDKEVFGL